MQMLRWPPHSRGLLLLSIPKPCLPLARTPPPHTRSGVSVKWKKRPRARQTAQGKNQDAPIPVPGAGEYSCPSRHTADGPGAASHLLQDLELVLISQPVSSFVKGKMFKYY